jgi:hypothetical protein
VNPEHSISALRQPCFDMTRTAEEEKRKKKKRKKENMYSYA